MKGRRRKHEVEEDRVLVVGRPDYERCNNKVVSARYTVLNFLPKAVLEQFRRFANLYFLTIGMIMFIGTYTSLFDSAISPWTTLGPLAVVISISLLVEGSADYKRHLNDGEVNNSKCIVLKNLKELSEDETVDLEPTILGGRELSVNINKAYYMNTSTTVRGMRQRIMTDPNDEQAEMVTIGFVRVARKDIRQGNLVLVRNREMVPADLLLLASSNDRGGAYIETSSIDGETNLKLRNSPRLPDQVLKALRDGTPLDSISETAGTQALKLKPEFESLEAATKRLTRFSALGRPHGESALCHPKLDNSHPEQDTHRRSRSPPRHRLFHNDESDKYVAALTTEPPNASVHTFSGKLTLPGFGDGECHQIPLGPENVLLRGAVIRNTEWIVGMSFFTGNETKLVLNSFATPSKFSQLDRLMNRTVIAVLILMFLLMSYLSTAAFFYTKEEFDHLFYVGFNKNDTETWPYLPDTFQAPKWKTEQNDWLQYFFLYITLVSNLIPLSLYVTIELVQFVMLWFIWSDLEMYDNTTDTRALARSTIVSDLGRIQYIFSDKTGTLTQNVMRFKRCSVDGMAFGSPIQRARNAESDEASETAAFHPLKRLLAHGSDQKLTFHAEMFLRVLSLCHTVVVEKDIDHKDQINSATSVSSQTSSRSMSSLTRQIFGRRGSADTPSSGGHRGRTDTSGSGVSGLHRVEEDAEMADEPRSRLDTDLSVAPGANEKSPDGAPAGYAYQAESPDEGALVSAASSVFGFQVVERDLNGICLRTSLRSHLQDRSVVDGLRNKTTTLDRLAAESASADVGLNQKIESDLREETWSILAINKFDSDRKRMSILVRSPPELGNIPILFCKGADSAMLDPSVSGGGYVMPSSEGILGKRLDLSAVSEENQGDDDVDEVAYGVAQTLGMRCHLGEFAKEGLRTLVLGMRILTEAECKDWLAIYQDAATSIGNREALLSDVAIKIETNLHIVGATAIEDKLQKDVPKTIATLGKAGIKLWVLTGDKRETAVEIGYSTNVLTSKMHLTEVADNGRQYVRTQMAMEFIRLTKYGRLPQYQKAALGENGRQTFRQRMRERRAELNFVWGKWSRRMLRSMLRFLASIMRLIGMKDAAEDRLEHVKELKVKEKNIIRDLELRKKVRARADSTIRRWIQREKDEGVYDVHHHGSDDEQSLASDEVPKVFQDAASARRLLNEIRISGELSELELREISLAYLTAQQQGEGGKEQNLIDEDALSLESFGPKSSGDLLGHFDRKKRTILERMFAVDKEVRKGRLMKHLTNERKLELTQEHEHPVRPSTTQQQAAGPRALVVEGAALKHLLGDPDYEEILFAVASSCEAVIACRVSPKQKAELVNLVRDKVHPEPITLAIGDGANDVGMIQEAHVGIGISGKEGKQAVNASDFAIAQFRFLETLILIHGRWNFFRLSAVVLFSFYKNAVMSGVIIVFQSRTVYSGTPVFDQWVVAMLNFVANFPIVFVGIFDRCLSKSYVLEHPEVYRATRENELFTFRTLLRWMALCLFHMLFLYYSTIPQQSWGGGITPAFSGLMGNEEEDRPGNGEGGDLLSVGTVTYTSMIILLAYKVLYEGRSVLHGRWPAFTCRKKAKEGFMSRLAYTWIGITYGSIGFYLGSIALYSLIGRRGASTFSDFTDVAMHVLGTRSLSWIIMFFMPIIGMVGDVCCKVFSNMFYPTQTQIHIEREALRKRDRKRRARSERRAALLHNQLIGNRQEQEQPNTPDTEGGEAFGATISL